MSGQQFDFIAIGDITTDAFIKLLPQNAHIVCDSQGRKCQICMNFGDKIEYDFVKVVPSVGNSPNAAVSAKRLGLKAGLVTNLGDDQFGKDCIAQLEKEGVDTEFVKVHAGKPSNYHYVLWYEEERTILVKHWDYEYKLPDVGEPKWLYLSSMGKASESFHDEIADYLDAHPSVKLSFQPGTFQMNLGIERLARIYKHADLFFCNIQEAQRILNVEEKDIRKLLEGMRALGPAMPVITDGPNGAYALDGEDVWFIPMYPDPKPPVNRTGAGDAFASTFTSMLAMGKTTAEALTYGPINSASVVQGVGAQQCLLTLAELEEWYKKAPADYKPRKI